MIPNRLRIGEASALLANVVETIIPGYGQKVQSLVSRQSAHASARRGVSLIEVIVVMTIVGILISMSAPKFHRSIEQSQADLVGANLLAIWSAQRLYWLEERNYAGDLAVLQTLDLLGPTTVNGTARYRYGILFADDQSFVATATRIGSERWSGQFTMNEQGVMNGAVQATGQPDIIPGFQ